MYGGILISSSAWQLEYEGYEGGVDLLPDEVADPWTKTETGSPAAEALNGILSMVVADGEMLNYEHAVVTLDNVAGCRMDIMVMVTASSADSDTGAAMILHDGDNEFVCWLRTDEINLHGFSPRKVDLSRLRQVTLCCQGLSCAVYVDGILAQRGYLASTTTAQKAVFGTIAGYGYASADWRWVRVRALGVNENTTEGEWLVEITADAVGHLSLPAYDPANPGASLDPEDSVNCCFATLHVDHSTEADFTIAEPPVFTNEAGTPWESLGVHFDVLAGTDGGQFYVRVTNWWYYGEGGAPSSGGGSGGPLSGGGSGPLSGVGLDIAYLWSRRGLVSV